MDIVTHKLINILIQVAKSDKALDDDELNLIYKIADQKKFSHLSVERLIQSTEPVETLGALSDHQKFEYLYNAILVLKADQVVHPSEVVFCQNLAVKMGLNKAVVDFLINEVNDGQKPEQLQNIEQSFKAFLL